MGGHGKADWGPRSGACRSQGHSLRWPHPKPCRRLAWAGAGGQSPALCHPGINSQGPGLSPACLCRKTQAPGSPLTTACL